MGNIERCPNCAAFQERMKHAETVAESWRRLADDNGAEAMRRAEQLRGAAEALEEIRNRLAPFVNDGEPAAEDALDIYEIAVHALYRLRGRS